MNAETTIDQLENYWKVKNSFSSPVLERCKIVSMSSCVFIIIRSCKSEENNSSTHTQHQSLSFSLLNRQVQVIRIAEIPKYTARFGSDFINKSPPQPQNRGRKSKDQRIVKSEFIGIKYCRDIFIKERERDKKRKQKKRITKPWRPFLFCPSFQQFLSHKCASNRPVHLCLK